MRRFFRLIEGSGRLHDLSSYVRSMLGEPLYLALCHRGVLQPGELAQRVRSKSADSMFSSMVIVQDQDSEQYPFLAIPADSHDQVMPTRLRRAEIETVVSSLSCLVLMVRELFDLVGEPNLQVSPFPRVYPIGETRAGRLVLLSTRTNGPDFAAFLRAQSIIRRPSVVLGLCRGVCIEATFEQWFGRGNHVELAFLEDLLVLDGEAIVLADTLATRNVPTHVAVVCLAFTHEGEMRLTREQYRALLLRRDEFALFLDLQTPVDGARYYVHKIDENAILTRGTVAKHGANIIAEYVRRRDQALLPLEIAYAKTAKLTNGDKIIEKARQQLDIKGKDGRYSWRAIHTRPGETRESKRYVFAPPADLKFAVIVPIVPAS